jgi:hypothetical protein
MDAVHISAWVRIVEAAVGFISICLGYRLFCELPLEKTRAAYRKVLVNAASGTLLALFGMASLLAAAGTTRVQPEGRSVHGTTRSLRSPGLRNGRHRPQFFA